MQKRDLVFGLIVITGLLVAGCTTNVSSGTPSVATTQVPLQTATTAGATQIPVAGASVSSAGGPLAAEVTRTGDGDGSVSFTTQAPGSIAITWDYGMNYYEPPKTQCEGEKGYYAVSLEGKSVSASLFTGKVDMTGRGKSSKNFNIITPGNYEITVSACYAWTITIDNA